MDHFALLGVPRGFQVDRGRLEQGYQERQARFHPDRFALASATERRHSLEWATQLNTAWRTLRDPVLRGGYLVRLLGGRGEGSTASGGQAGRADMNDGDPEFLMTVMEMREELAELSANPVGTGERVAQLRQEIERRIATELTGLEKALTRALAATSAPVLAEAERHLDHLRYHQRFIEELERLEEELA
ncbi:MAG: Fe-S protein assembly co-chaperone HscB [Magnetococcales bacterium]|nr:Fe-S protein assembly co-chaperone HscB [Magnetococcales bacterium]